MLKGTRHKSCQSTTIFDFHMLTQAHLLCWEINTRCANFLSSSSFSLSFSFSLLFFYLFIFLNHAYQGSDGFSEVHVGSLGCGRMTNFLKPMHSPSGMQPDVSPERLDCDWIEIHCGASLLKKHELIRSWDYSWSIKWFVIFWFLLPF